MWSKGHLIERDQAQRTPSGTFWYLFSVFTLASVKELVRLRLHSWFSEWWKEMSSEVSISHNFRFTWCTTSRWNGSERTGCFELQMSWKLHCNGKRRPWVRDCCVTMSARDLGDCCLQYCMTYENRKKGENVCLTRINSNYTWCSVFVKPAMWGERRTSVQTICTCNFRLSPLPVRKEEPLFILGTGQSGHTPRVACGPARRLPPGCPIKLCSWSAPL